MWDAGAPGQQQQELQGATGRSIPDTASSRGSNTPTPGHGWGSGCKSGKNTTQAVRSEGESVRTSLASPKVREGRGEEALQAPEQGFPYIL